MTVPDVPLLFVHWESFVGWLLDRTERFPKRLRFTLTNRIDNLALDVFQDIAEARFSHDSRPALQRISRSLDTLRLFLRLVRDRRHLDSRSFEYACKQIDEAGRMVGGWLKEQRGRQ